MKRNLKAVGATAVALAVMVGLAAAAPGGLDPSFGDGGVVTTAVAPGAGEDFQNGLVILADRSIVVGGSSDMGPGQGGFNWRLIGYTRDGNLDPAFGQGGVGHTSIAPGDSPAGPFGTSEHMFELLRQADGKLVGAGFTDMGAGSGGFEFAVARYHADGTLDPSFGSDGTVTTTMGPGDNIDIGQGLALQADGKIVVGGVARYGAANERESATSRSHGTSRTAHSTPRSATRVASAPISAAA